MNLSLTPRRSYRRRSRNEAAGGIPCHRNRGAGRDGEPARTGEGHRAGDVPVNAVVVIPDVHVACRGVGCNLRPRLAACACTAEQGDGRKDAENVAAQASGLGGTRPVIYELLPDLVVAVIQKEVAKSARVIVGVGVQDNVIVP